jgi:hypothetical protein
MQSVSIKIRVASSILPMEAHCGGVIVSVIFLSMVDREFESWFGQIKDYKIGYVLLLR